MTRRHSRRTRGFSLLELSVALAVLVIISTTILGGLGSLLEGSEDAGWHMVAVEQERKIYEELRSALSAVDVGTVDDSGVAVCRVVANSYTAGGDALEIRPTTETSGASGVTFGWGTPVEYRVDAGDLFVRASGGTVDVLAIRVRWAHFTVAANGTVTAEVRLATGRTDTETRTFYFTPAS